MLQKNGASAKTTVSLNVVEPYDFEKSLKAVRSFQRIPSDQDDRLRLAARIDGVPALVEVGEGQGHPRKVTATSMPVVNADRLRAIVEWLLFAELDLTPFYLLAHKNPKLVVVTEKFRGLKPMRPVSLFEMAVIAITEQQISLAAAYQIRSRIIQRYGVPVDSYWIFPEPRVLASAPLEDLRSYGLSRQKAQYIHDIATNIVEGRLDLDVLKTMDDDAARETIMRWRGFGRWSADYFLVRGLARPDCVPVDDIGIRNVVGKYLGGGERATAIEVAEELEPFRPYRGLLAFYLLIEDRSS